MSWFDATGFANLAKTALKGAQKKIDKALDINDEDLNASESQTASIDSFGDTFFNSWGVDEPAVKEDDRLRGETSSAEASTSALPKKLTSSTSLWGSFTGSFFENPTNPTEGESSNSSSTRDPFASRPTKLATDRPGAFRSLSLELPVHSKVSGDPSELLSPPKDDAKKGASSETQSEGSDQQHQKQKEDEEKEEGMSESRGMGLTEDDGSSIRDEIRNYPAVEVVMRERKPRNYTNRLSAISSESDRRSSESCEVIGSLTPESERTTSISTSSSVARLRQSGSFGSVEVLTSPSSVEVLGSSSSNTTSVDETGKERYSSDSISPVAENECVEVIPELLEDEDDPSLAEDSYTSASESTLNTTVLEYGGHPSTDRRLNWDCITLEDICSDAKVGSSEHTSGDELETATSSDIEVISSPTPNGDSSSAASRQSPAKLHHDKTPKPRFGSWLTMTGRSSSEAYDSFSAKQKGHQRDHSGASSGGSEDSEVEKLHKKISEMKEIIEARESKLFDLSRANSELQEANADLRSQLESQDMSQMSERFMQRLAALERKFQQAIREKEVLRKQLEYAKAAAAASEREAESEKDQVIAELREEGEKLSKQQLSLNNMIKKLRATEKDNQKSISSLKEQVDEANQELERAKKSLSAKEEVERTQIEAVHQLTKANQLLEKELDESREECRQLSEEARRAVRSAEDGVRRRLEEELEAASTQQEQLEATIHDLRDKLSQAVEVNVQRESELRQENSELLRRLEAAELRAEEASDAASSMTRPLLRQIDALTAAASDAALGWDKQEKAHLNTIGGLQSQLTQQEESERASREECARLSSVNASLEMRCTLAQQEIENLKAKIATLTAQNDCLKEEKTRISEEFEKERTKLQGSAEEWRREARALEEQLAVERAAVDAERRKNNVLHDTLRTRGASNTSPQTASPRSSPTLSFGRVSVSESLASAAWPTLGEDAFESASTSGRLACENIRPEYNTTFIESLQAHLKLRDGEVQQMQWELAKRDTERCELRDQVAALTAKSEDQGAQLAALATQYDALLQMYGEKMEESQELRMDLQDVKDMYKAQIDQLLKKEPSVNT
ncbi:hypothetical protein LSTR_LSTR012236 [Laodelphax striatellus]|uniref:TATA element modulatory factor 1 TATA binding domain-containing protein n=1 Tax=Laodelphax striatellus TaxID=195883 RepID=A0A482WRZ8_LAOST|nr:hypothetical protein LSTR_LSTR012236 [Laodelphax striatellus]